MVRRASAYSHSSDDHSDIVEDFEDLHDEDNQQRAAESRVKAIRSSLERLGCHVPICVARTLEDNALIVQHAEKDDESGSNPPQNSSHKRLSWSAKPTDSHSGVFLDSGSQHSSSTKESTTLRGGRSRTSIPQFSSHSSGRSLTELFKPNTPGQFPMPLPNEDVYYETALLLVDISGFTRLSTLLNVESLSKAINTYFDLLIKQVEAHGGDVLKFAGDAFFAEWREESDLDLEEAVLQAALCGASIVQRYSKYHVPQLSDIADSFESHENALLDVHCGIGVGQLACLHVGNHTSRREFLFVGEPIEQVSAAEAFTKHGQLGASPEAMELLENTCDIELPEEHQEGSPVVIAWEGERYFEPGDPSLVEDLEQFRQEPPSYLSMVLPLNIMEPLKHQMALYVHPATRFNHSRNVIADAEIRSVYTVFVKPNIKPYIKGNPKDDTRLFALLNDIMGVTSRILDRFKGHLRQFIVDDKGVVLIATWGQRGATFPNMVTEKGLPATIAIHDTLKIELDVDSLVGATFGKAYCGVVGGTLRHEFAVLGPSVNLAARLMSSSNNPGILVDNAVRLMASKRFDFFAHRPVKAKGYLDVVPIFEPMSAIERQWNKIGNFVGREKELKKLVNVGRTQLVDKSGDIKARLVLIQAHSGLGKSSLAMQAIDMIRRMGGKFNKNIKITKNVCKDGEQQVPFCVFRQILHDLLMEQIETDSDYNDKKDWDSIDDNGSDSSLSMDEALVQETVNFNEKRLFDRLRILCKELDYNEDFADLIGENMLGLTPVNDAAKQQLPPNELIDFVADAFLKYTGESDLVVSALDDVQWMDSLSWKVVQRMIERGKRLFIICISRPIDTSNVSIDQQFLKEIREESKKKDEKCAVFTEIKLEAFTKSDVRKLLSMAFGCEGSYLDDEVCDYLYEQSGGMPYFCHEIVGNMIRKDLLEWQKDGLVRWRSGITDCQKALHSNMNDLLLNRLDDFKSDGRTLLQVCAVLGFEFSLTELLKVQSRGRRRIKQKQVEKVEGVLAKADKEGILVEIFQGGANKTLSESDGEGDEDGDDHANETGDFAEKSYMFRHAIWRNCLLGTMLEERKRELHKTIATKLGGTDIQEVAEPRFAMKLFGHWRDSGDLGKATELALNIGKYLDGLLLLRESITFCTSAIQVWKDFRSGTGDDGESVAGISIKTLDNVTPHQISYLARLYISVAKNYSNIRDAVNSNIFYESIDLILSTPSVVTKVEDRSVFFVLYSGRFSLLYIGAIPDDGLILQMEIANKFVNQAQIHGDPIHICRALSMKSLTLSRQGKFEEAIDAQKQLEEIYHAEKLCADICREYSCDHTAQNYGYSVLWYEVLGRSEEAMLQIDFILEELMPQMPAKNMHNSIMILYPVIFVLKEKGMTRKAEHVFLKHIYECFYEFYGKDATTYFLFIYEPLRVLFQLVRNVEEGSCEDGDELRKLEDWVLSSDIGTYTEMQWGPMCAMGRDPYCIIAEICLLLVTLRCNGRSDVERRQQLLEKGLEQAQKSTECTQGNPGFEYARKHQSEKIVAQFSNL